MVRKKENTFNFQIYIIICIMEELKMKVMLIIIAILTLAIVVLIFIIKSKNKTIKFQESQINENNQIIKKVVVFLKNNSFKRNTLKQNIKLL